MAARRDHDIQVSSGHETAGDLTETEQHRGAQVQPPQPQQPLRSPAWLANRQIEIDTQIHFADVHPENRADFSSPFGISVWFHAAQFKR
jgi:hypothetical protein